MRTFVENLFSNNIKYCKQFQQNFVCVSIIPRYGWYEPEKLRNIVLECKTFVSSPIDCSFRNKRNT